jgi:hypothetical protein
MSFFLVPWGQIAPKIIRIFFSLDSNLGRMHDQKNQLGNVVWVVVANCA